jgi:hypothetical protein
VEGDLDAPDRLTGAVGDTTGQTARGILRGGRAGGKDQEYEKEIENAETGID